MGKRMTAKEKKLRAEVRAELRKDGIIPPKKAPLNRKKFAAEVWAEYEAIEDKFILRVECIPEALAYVSSGTAGSKYSAEAIGALKVIKLAMDIQKFKTELNTLGRSATIQEYFDKVIMPVINL